jgi:hypothetical protein
MFLFKRFGESFDNLKMELRKSRDLTISDLFTRLQIEYLSYYTRYKLWKREKDKKKFKDICQKKREKIESISLKQSFPSIFNNEQRKNIYIYEKFLQSWGIPNFDYRDDYQLKTKGNWDKTYFFYKGTDVICRDKGVEYKGKVLHLDYVNNLVIILCKENEKTFKIHTNINNIKRELPEDFFKNLI